MSPISSAQGSALGGIGSLGEPVQAQPGPGSPGLVSSKTSDTPQQNKVLEPFAVDPGKARIKRMRKGVLTAARLNQEAATAHGHKPTVAMLTLTYREDVDWQPRHITGLIKRIRQWAKRRGVPWSYVWVMELTQRGRPHYHAVIWLPKGLSLPKPDKQGWWPWGSTRIERARSAVGYVAKYVSKGGNEVAFPKGARSHDCGGLTPDHRLQRSWWMCPFWVRQAWADYRDRPRPAPGGGWGSKVLGDWLPSPWSVWLKAGQVWAVWKGIPWRPDITPQALPI